MRLSAWTATATSVARRSYEGPDDIHLVGRNASKTKPAKFLAFFVKDRVRPS